MVIHEEVINNSVLVIETEEEDLKVVIDITTGVVLHLEHIDASIYRLDLFIKAAKARYKKYVRNNELSTFLD